MMVTVAGPAPARAASNTVTVPILVPNDASTTIPAPATVASPLPADQPIIAPSSRVRQEPSAKPPTPTKRTPVAGQLVLTRELCDSLVDATPAPDLAYQEGVDAYGRPVAPADLNSATKARALPDRVETQIILEDSVGPRGLGPLTGRRGETYPAIVAVDPRSGEVTLNGQPLEDQRVAALQRACAAQREQR